ncbi:Ribosomal large subunit pseudouridine synthase D [uncultured Roseburia sp.]|uniref:Pseudouridine synthase n=1 Tax=Brotonthovivens ammoniilytica TaxID=2981725 RepID=A0ABT2TH25_9FIRM|nr:RluA family pseudouridine synthase [Brotonthovivens ammoniilytica]MCU6761480.1 RluA family pseudouridine synthase [Brotonthovivens ammoniilytica]SCI29696.1 Ribosomal large subunit pseudouridine synthase D [uncultured Roseburia sp.]
MKRIFEYHMTKKENGSTILEFLKAKGYSHSVMVHLKKTPEGILKNGSWSYVSEKLQADDTLTIRLLEDTGSEKIVPNDKLPFPVIYEDEDILVINKPAGMPIHPSMNNYDNTLANAAAAYFARQNTPYVYRCINRLDRDTSGLTILARHMLSGAILARHSGLSEISREYTAIVAGCPPLQGTVNAPIARTSDSAIARCVDTRLGVSAITHYRRLLYNSQKDLSLIRLKLETGRTHQIRVHMKYAGYPLIGDFLYHPDYRYIERQALHSSHLSFIHPITGKLMQFEAPLPEDMQLL